METKRKFIILHPAAGSYQVMHYTWTDEMMISYRKKYGIKDFPHLNAVITISSKSIPFYEAVFDAMKSAIFLKKVVFWLKKKSFTDHLFTLKTYFR